MSTLDVIDAWCRTLGNYTPRLRPALQTSRSIATTWHNERETSMALKPPRQPNPNIALLDRRRSMFASVARSAAWDVDAGASTAAAADGARTGAVESMRMVAANQELLDDFA